MFKKLFFLLLKGTILLMILLLSGCCMFPDQNKLEKNISCIGLIMIPSSLNNNGDSIVEPFATAKVVLFGSEGDVILTETNQEGKWIAQNFKSPYYLLEAVKDGVIIKKVFPFQSLGENNINVGEANAYTSCQVMIYEIANQYYENALYLREVPDLVIPENLVKSVEKVYRENRNPFNDPFIIRMVEDLVLHQF
ncbi:MAG: hypothetical protein GX428_06400 [Candidatus Atribacteria bacterium]|nr:hypothetical protein [Candidatus Atribacteria bacterium]